MAFPDDYRPYGGTTADLVVSEETVSGTDVLTVAGGSEFDVYDAASGGTQITDLCDASGAAITQVTAEDDGHIARFYAPNTVAEVWLDSGSGRVQALAADAPASSSLGRSILAADTASEVRDLIDAGSAGAEAGEVEVDDLIDATTTGKQLLKTNDTGLMRDLIGAGTSSLQLGSTGSTAAAGNHSHVPATTSTPGFMSGADKSKLNQAGLAPILYDVGTSSWPARPSTSVAPAGTITFRGPVSAPTPEDIQTGDVVEYW